MTSLRSFVMVRIALFIPMVWFLITIVFLIVRVLPGADPIVTMNPQIPEENAEQIAESLGLNRPLHEQYFDFLKRIFSLDFGISYRTNDDVGKEIQYHFGPTVMLAFFGSLIGIPLGILLGGYSGSNREKFSDHFVRLFTLGVYSIPIFLLGRAMQIYLSMENDIFPAVSLLPAGATAEFTHYTKIWIIDTLLSGRFDLTWELILHLIMPSTCLGLLIASSITRIIRINMIHQLEQDYVHFARSRGVPETIVKYKYALRNAVAPTIGVIGLYFALLLSGAILTETTFNIPGLGRYLFLAIQERDYAPVQAVIVLYAIIVSIVSLFTDILYAIVDPRIKY